MTALVLNLSSLIDGINDRDLEILSRDNPDVRLEINSAGQLVFIPPTGSESGKKNSSLLAQIWYWNNRRW